MQNRGCVWENRARRKAVYAYPNAGRRITGSGTGRVQLVGAMQQLQ
jgi:hypothetical protein